MAGPRGRMDGNTGTDVGWETEIFWNFLLVSTIKVSLQSFVSFQNCLITLAVRKSKQVLGQRNVG